MGLARMGSDLFFLLLCGQGDFFEPRTCLVVTVHDGVYHTPGAAFPSSIARQPRGRPYRTIARLRKALGEMFPTLTLVAPTLFQPSIYRPWKIGPGGCDILYTVYGTADGLLEECGACLFSWF